MTEAANDLSGLPVDFEFPVTMVKGVAKPIKPPTRLSLADAVAEWRREGRLHHEPTGFAELDRVTGGGPTYGIRAFLIGPPDAAKTLFLAQLGDTWVQRGIAVGILSIDEEAGDLATRFAQRRGFSRSDCEVRDSTTLDKIEEAVDGLHLVIYRDPETTIEAAAEDLAKYMTENDIKRGALFVDSVQTVTSRALQGNETPLIRVTANVKAIRAMAIAHKLIVIATSETSRAFYRAADEADKLDKIAAGKESGALEYAGRLMMYMNNVGGSPDLLKVEITKNKLGPKAEFFWKIDRLKQTLSEVERQDDAPSAVATGFIKKAAAVHQIIIDHPEIGTTKLRAAVGALKVTNMKIGVPVLNAILDYLEDKKKIEVRMMRGARGPEGPHYLPVSTVVDATPPPPPPVGMHVEDDEIAADNELLIAAMEN